MLPPLRLNMIHVPLNALTASEREASTSRLRQAILTVNHAATKTGNEASDQLAEAAEHTAHALQTIEHARIRIMKETQRQVNESLRPTQSRQQAYSLAEQQRLQEREPHSKVAPRLAYQCASACRQHASPRAGCHAACKLQRTTASLSGRSFPNCAPAASAARGGQLRSRVAPLPAPATAHHKRSAPASAPSALPRSGLPALAAARSGRGRRFLPTCRHRARPAATPR
jgi:hypothetical protein